MMFDLDAVRRQFPALSDGGWTFFDNAGGSQTLKRVVDRIGEFLLTSDVQLGASYDVSRLAGERVAEARARLARLVNAERPEEIVMGPTSTALFRNLAEAIAPQLKPGDEIIVTDADHEVNISPWLKLARTTGAELRWWRLNQDSQALELEALDGLLSEHTRLVCMTHTSNILGAITPIADIARRVHAVGGKLCVDGVAYAPHRLIDVRAWDVDFYTFSCYKVYGPHHALMYGKYQHLLELDSLYHEFIGKEKVPSKLEPGNCNYELAYGCTGISDYLCELGGGVTANGDVSHDTERAALGRAFDAIATHETALGEQLLDYLRGKNRVRIVGPRQSDAAIRVPTIAFSVDDTDSEIIVRHVDQHKIGIRFGDFYSCRLIDALGLRSQNGVVRVSMVHYNSLDEVDRLIGCLDEVM